VAEIRQQMLTYLEANGEDLLPHIGAAGGWKHCFRGEADASDLDLYPPPVQ
jgi:hypothetical protein